MCWACEEDAIWRRYQLEMAVQSGEIPPGFEPEDFELAGLPVPPKRAASKPATADSRAGGSLANPFACDEAGDNK